MSCELKRSCYINSSSNKGGMDQTLPDHQDLIQGQGRGARVTRNNHIINHPQVPLLFYFTYTFRMNVLYSKNNPQLFSGNEFPNDWTKSFDPKTQRIYYYSKSRKVSSWTLPADVHPDHLSETSGPLDSVAHSSVSRSSSNSSRHRRSESPMLFGRGATSSQSQSPSPPFGTNEMLRASSASSHSTRSRSPAVGGTRGTWIKAFDQRTERFYWYNRYVVLLYVHYRTHVE